MIRNKALAVLAGMARQHEIARLESAERSQEDEDRLQWLKGVESGCDASAGHSAALAGPRGRHRLTDPEVRGILTDLLCGLNQYEVARKWNVGQSTVSQIANGRVHFGVWHQFALEHGGPVEVQSHRGDIDEEAARA